MADDLEEVRRKLEKFSDRLKTSSTGIPEQQFREVYRQQMMARAATKFPYQQKPIAKGVASSMVREFDQERLERLRNDANEAAMQAVPTRQGSDLGAEFDEMAAKAALAAQEGRKFIDVLREEQKMRETESRKEFKEQEDQAEKRYRQRVQEAKGDKDKESFAKIAYQEERRRIRDNSKTRQEELEKLSDQVAETAKTLRGDDDQEKKAKQSADGLRQRLESGIGGPGGSLIRLMGTTGIGAAVGTIASSGGTLLGTGLGAAGGWAGGKVGAMFGREAQGAAIGGGLLGAVGALASAIGGLLSQSINEALEIDRASGALAGVIGGRGGVRADYEDPRRKQIEKRMKEIAQNDLDRQTQYGLDRMQRYEVRNGIRQLVTGRDGIDVGARPSSMMTNDEKLEVPVLQKELQRFDMTSFEALGIKRSEALERQRQQALAQGSSRNVTERAFETAVVERALGQDQGDLLAQDRFQRYGGRSGAQTAVALQRALYGGTQEGTDRSRLAEALRANTTILERQLQSGLKVDTASAVGLQSAFAKQFQPLGLSAERSADVQGQLARSIGGQDNQYAESLRLRAIQEAGRRKGVELDLVQINDLSSKLQTGDLTASEEGVDAFDILKVISEQLGGNSYAARSARQQYFGKYIPNPAIRKAIETGDFEQLRKDYASGRRIDASVDDDLFNQAAANTGMQQQFQASVTNNLADIIGQPITAALQPIIKALQGGDLFETFGSLTKSIDQLKESIDDAKDKSKGGLFVNPTIGPQR